MEKKHDVTVGKKTGLGRSREVCFTSGHVNNVILFIYSTGPTGTYKSRWGEDRRLSALIRDAWSRIRVPVHALPCLRTRPRANPIVQS